MKAMVHLIKGGTHVMGSDMFIVVFFFAGDFLKETQPGKEVDYVSTWLTFKF